MIDCRAEDTGATINAATAAHSKTRCRFLFMLASFVRSIVSEGDVAVALAESYEKRAESVKRQIAELIAMSLFEPSALPC
jgi:hypothetical protein